MYGMKEKKKTGSVVQHVNIFCVVKIRHVYIYNFLQKMTRICFKCLILFPFVKHIHTHNVLILFFIYRCWYYMINIHKHTQIYKYTYTPLLKDVCKYSKYIWEKKTLYRKISNNLKYKSWILRIFFILSI